MAQQRHKLTFELPDEEAVRRDFAVLGENAKGWLEWIITSDKMTADTHLTAYNLGIESVARTILGFSHKIEETKIIKNLET